MSHNTDPQKAAKRHPAPIIAIVVALVIAAFAAFLFIDAEPAENDDVSRIEAGAETGETSAEPGAAELAQPDAPAPTAADGATTAPAD